MKNLICLSLMVFLFACNNDSSNQTESNQVTNSKVTASDEARTLIEQEIAAQSQREKVKLSNTVQLNDTILRIDGTWEAIDDPSKKVTIDIEKGSFMYHDTVYGNTTPDGIRACVVLSKSLIVDITEREDNVYLSRQALYGHDSIAEDIEPAPSPYGQTIKDCGYIANYYSHPELLQQLIGPYISSSIRFTSEDTIYFGVYEYRKVRSLITNSELEKVELRGQALVLDEDLKKVMGIAEDIVQAPTCSESECLSVNTVESKVIQRMEQNGCLYNLSYKIIDMAVAIEAPGPRSIDLANPTQQEAATPRKVTGHYEFQVVLDSISYVDQAACDEQVKLDIEAGYTIGSLDQKVLTIPR